MAGIAAFCELTVNIQWQNFRLWYWYHCIIQSNDISYVYLPAPIRQYTTVTVRIVIYALLEIVYVYGSAIWLDVP